MDMKKKKERIEKSLKLPQRSSINQYKREENSKAIWSNQQSKLLAELI